MYCVTMLRDQCLVGIYRVLLLRCITFAAILSAPASLDKLLSPVDQIHLVL